MNIWLDKILQNLNRIEQELLSENPNYNNLRINTIEQYRLISLLRKTLDGKMTLHGWKFEKE